MSECMAKAIEVLKPRLASGDLGGGYLVPQVEPLHFSE